MEPFVCYYYRSNRFPKLIYDRQSQRYVANPSVNVPRTPFKRQAELLESGGQFARLSKSEIEETLGARFPEKHTFGRSDVWFPQIVISTQQRSAYVNAIVHDVRSSYLKPFRVVVLDPGEWGCHNGRPYFVTDDKLFPHWKGEGPWAFLEMCFPNLPERI